MARGVTLPARLPLLRQYESLRARKRRAARRQDSGSRASAWSQRPVSSPASNKLGSLEAAL